jgi:hypothetical protein
MCLRVLVYERLHTVQPHLCVVYACKHTHTHTHLNTRHALTSMCGCRFRTPQHRDPPRACLAQPASTRTSHRLSRAWRVRLMLRRPRGARPSPTVLATPARRGLTEAHAHYVMQESTSLSQHKDPRPARSVLREPFRPEQTRWSLCEITLTYKHKCMYVCMYVCM